METGFLLSDFAQQLRHKNADVEDIYFTLHDAAGESSTLVVYQNDKDKDGGNCVFFKMFEASKVAHAGRFLLWISAQFGEN